jgi:hypothetical protein
MRRARREGGIGHGGPSMVAIASTCGKCRRGVRLSVSQTVQRGELRWGTSYQCEFCGTAEESDGVGAAPEDVRRAIIEQDGEWGLTVTDVVVVPTALRVLRQALALSISETAAIKRGAPGTLVRGTRVEMMRLEAAMRKAGVDARVARCAPAS